MCIYIRLISQIKTIKHGVKLFFERKLIAKCVQVILKQVYLYTPDFKEKTYCNKRYFFKTKNGSGRSRYLHFYSFYLVNIYFQNIQRQSEFCVSHKIQLHNFGAYFDPLLNIFFFICITLNV